MQIPSPFCPRSPVSPEKEVFMSDIINIHIFDVPTNADIPFGPGAPFSPFRE